MAKPNREVTEFDLRAPEFQHPSVKPEDYEFRDDGKVVRKDRWETTVRNIVSALGWSRRDFELPEVVAEVRQRLDCGIDGDEEYDSWVITPDGVPAPVVPQGYRAVPIKKLVKLASLIDPEPIDVDGRRMVFKNPMAAEVLTRLSAEIRELLELRAPDGVRANEGGQRNG